MTIKQIRTALDTRLLSLSGLLPTAWDNKRLSPAPASTQPYQVVSLMPARTDNPTLTEELRIESGIYQVLLYFPQEGGAGKAETMAEAIQAHFPAGLNLTSGGVKLRIRGTPAIAAGYQNADRYLLPITIRYHCVFQ